MLASFTSILPSGISFNLNKDERERERQDKEKERERAAQEEVTPRPNDSNDGKLKDAAVDEQGVKKKRERSPNETFIVVRPPPSVSNHPLNLQLQLVPPQPKERSVSGASAASGLSNTANRASVDYSAQSPEEVGESVVRAESTRTNRSEVSSFYASSSSASMSSIASSASTTSAGGRRMIVPLYNLSAHNVVTNTVLDAGTDAKVAKFHKRGMEILALAVLECVEIWPSYGRGRKGHVTFLNATNGAHVSGAGGTVDADALLVTPTSSAISLSSAGSHPPQVHSHYSHPLPPIPNTPTSSTSLMRGSVTPTPTQSGAKRIFGKIFNKKRDSSETTGLARSQSRSGSSEAAQNRNLASPTTSETGHGSGFTPALGKRRSLTASSPTPSQFAPPPLPGTIAQPVLQPAVLGIQPTLSAPLNPPVGRPTKYVWIVRKWLKGGDGGLLGGVIRGVNMVGAGIGMTALGERSNGGSNIYSTAGQRISGGSTGVEVRFEWVRGQSKNQEKVNAKKNAGQAALGKRASVSFSEEGAELRSRRSGVTDSSDKPPEKSRSRARRAAAASSGQAKQRFSGESRHSAEIPPTTSRTNSMTSASVSDEAQAMLRSTGPTEEDDGEESDPEDSETPWTCTLVVSSIPSDSSALWEFEHADLHHPLIKEHSRRSNLGSTQEEAAPAANARAPGPSREPSNVSATPNTRPSTAPAPKTRIDAPGTLLRLKVGALSPAPHHPKVVVQLKVPYPLPDVEVTRGRIRRRVLTPAGVARPVSGSETMGNGDGDRDERDRPRSRGGMFGANGLMGGGDGPEGLVLTAEEIKDVLSCTAFWIVVREGFGGVGKVNRKGDGWRIRG